MTVSPVTLEGALVRLEPLQLTHIEPLAALIEPGMFGWYTAPPETPAQMRDYVVAARRDQTLGTALPFATCLRDGTAIGSTRFGNIDSANRKVEIGWTWIAPRWRGTGVNTEAKLLMLGHAFEVLDCRRVEFKTDARNERSRAALVAIGAVEEGTLRAHMVCPDGDRRDSVYFSILADEWPRVRERLTARLARHAQQEVA